jgi:hypothetical protein
MTQFEGEWLHIVATYDASATASGIKLYCNGAICDTTNTQAGTYVAMHTDAPQFGICVNNQISSPSICDGKFDEVFVYDFELTQEQVVEIMNNGLINETYNYTNTTQEVNESINSSNPQYMTEDIIGEITENIQYFINCTNNSDTYLSEFFQYNFNNDFTPPVITLINPSNNTLVTSPLNVNASTNEDATCSLQPYWTASTGGTLHQFTDTGAPDDWYWLNISCTDGGGNSGYILANITLDNIEPTITILTPSESNDTVVDFNESYNVRIDFSDTNFFSYGVLVFDPFGAQIYNFTEYDIDVSSVNFLESIVPDKLGNWTITVEASDDHTKSLIEEDYKYKKINTTKLRFEFDEKKHSKLLSKTKAVDISYVTGTEMLDWTLDKEKDRYIFGIKTKAKFKKDDTQTTMKFRLECENLHYLESSPYIAHFVCWGTKNWVDFENDDIISYEVQECGADCYEITMDIKVSENQDTFKFHSIGGVNINTKAVTFTVEDLPEDVSILGTYECETETTADVLLIFGVFAMLIAIYTLHRKYVKIPLFGLIISLGFAFFFFSFIACHQAIGLIGVGFSIVLGVYEVMR